MSPVSRVSQGQTMRNLLRNIHGEMKTQDQILQKVSSNKRVERPSDDPKAIGKILKIKDQLLRNEEFESTILDGTTWIELSYTAIETSLSAWRRVGEIAISSVDASQSMETRQILAQELDQLLQYLVEAGNSMSNGRYLFSGSKTDQLPFRVEKNPETGKITHVFYEGNNQERELRTSDTSSFSINLPGSNQGNSQVPGSFIDREREINLFDTLISLRDQVSMGEISNIAGRNGLLQKIEKSANHLIQIESHISMKKQRLEADQEKLMSNKETLSKYLGKLEEADVAQLMLELNNSQTTYEAALRVSGRIARVGLLDFI